MPLYPVVQHHLETFLAETRDADPMGWGVPRWVGKTGGRCGSSFNEFSRPRILGTRGQVKSRVSAIRQRPSGRGLVSEGVLLEKLAREGGKEALAERVVVGGVLPR
jgi:hypothetical protein